ncbi:f44a26c6-9f6f-4d51-a4bd-2e7c602368ca [Sclerotinia trifoliorum]|uniref:F44a26c6-9f6f-4d51-a4bd-2e7c602368ca n=1 Tax=Sclerotinia trifoliorum TaxID=28548 RepID=A0A8H2VXH1_9HELO|nr:f44a26c6-9f6f-4d51-a4bd-2e7c602368ca [Sclerotinia trifoliorum]
MNLNKYQQLDQHCTNMTVIGKHEEVDICHPSDNLETIPTCWGLHENRILKTGLLSFMLLELRRSFSNGIENCVWSDLVGAVQDPTKRNHIV